MSSQPPWGPPPGPPGWGPAGPGQHGAGPHGYPQQQGPQGFGQPPSGPYAGPPYGGPPGPYGAPYGAPPGGAFGAPGYGAPMYMGAPQKSSSGKVIVALIIAAFVVVAGIGALVAVGVYAAKKEASAGPSELVTASDGKTEIKVPPRWSTMTQLNDEANLQVGNAASEEYLVVISESKQDFAPEVDLKKYSDGCLELMRGRIKNVSVSSPKNVTIGGRPAVQYELTGSVDLINIGYLVTFVDGQKGYHQVIAWTMKSMLSDKKKKLADVTETFRER
ncbi:MAG: hypothetical protein IPG04_04115 [Polyangiaceae bacterium]|nr:hypothetical protein [Polyangiaceae bacterium]